MVKVYYSYLEEIPENLKELSDLQHAKAREILKIALRKNGFDPAPLLKTQQGKPYFEKIPLFVSISHDGETVVVALSDHEIGVDTEKIGRVNDKVLLRFVGKTSRSEIGRTRLWTQYEALGKYLGCGIPLPEEGLPKTLGYKHFKRREYDICVCFEQKEAPLLEKI